MQLVMIMIFVAYLMVDTASSEPTTDTNVQVFNIPSCQHFTAQLHYYCSYEKSGENLLITASHLNTDKISENLCGKYDNQQGDVCYDIPLLVLKSNTKGLCFSSNTTVSNNNTMKLTNISVTLTANDASHRYHTQCGTVEAPVPLGHFEFDCTSSDEPKEVHFIIRGYSFPAGHWWSATVRALIPHNCSTEMSETDNESLHLLEILLLAVYTLVLALMIVCVICLAYCCYKKYHGASNGHTKSHDAENTNDTVVVNRMYNFVWCPCHHDNTVTVKIDPDPSLPANGTPHLQDNRVEQDDTHSNSKNINFDKQHSVSTTDAVSQGKDEASMTTTNPQSELGSVANSTLSRLGVINPQQDTSPQGTMNSLLRNKRNIISDNTMKRRTGDMNEVLQEHNGTTKL